MQRRHVLAGLLAIPSLKDRPARMAGLVTTGPVRSSSDNQVIEGPDIVAPSGDALVLSHRGLTVRDGRIRHATGHRVYAHDAEELVLQNLEVVRSVPSTPGTEEHSNINLSSCPGAVLTNIRAVRGSSNIYIEHSQACRIRAVELHDARGSYPRGQNIQMSWSPGCILGNFSGENGPTSWTEDNVSVFCSDRCTVRRELASYNNGPTGNGVMLEDSFDCLIQDVDAVEQGNGGFAAVPMEDFGSGRCVFLRCRTRASYNARRDGRNPTVRPSTCGLRPAPESTRSHSGLAFPSG